MQFSVVIPAKNAALTLEAAIMSALDQFETSVEVIVIDDGSTDETSRLIDKLRMSDDRLVSFRNLTSVGVSAARNQAIAAARGEWIALLDADDEFLPGRLNRMVKEAESRALDMFADNLALRSETGEDQGVAFERTASSGEGPLSLSNFLLQDVPGLQPMGIGFCKPIIRRDFLVNSRVIYDENLSGHEDFLFYAECLLAGARFDISYISGYLYTVRTGGHGTKFNLLVSNVNRRIMRSAKRKAPAAIPSLHIRQRAIDYDGLRKSLQALRYFEALKFLYSLPPLFIAGRIRAVVTDRIKKIKKYSLK